MNDLLKTLGLRYVEKGLPDLYEQARMHSLTYDAFLRRVLTMEVEARKLATGQKRLKAAKLPTRNRMFGGAEFPLLCQRVLHAL